MHEIRFAPEYLGKWLRARPRTWRNVIAFRSAMRAVPCIDRARFKILEPIAEVIFPALFMSWAVSSGYKNIFFENERFARKTYDAAKLARDEKAPIGAFLAVDSIADATYSAINGDRAQRAAETAARAARAYVRRNQDEPYNELAATMEFELFWNATTRDCEWLTASRTDDKSESSPPQQRLWINKTPAGWSKRWKKLAKTLLAIDPNYLVWIEWYERRVRGSASAFDIPNDTNREEEIVIVQRLASATYENFWRKGYRYVNAQLSLWLNEARQRAARKSLPITEALDLSGSSKGILDAINPDPQDARSPQFGTDSTGRIAIKANAGADQLRSDTQSLSRHARALRMAQRLAEALRNHNNAGYITEMALDYVAAMKDGEDGPDPSGLVFAGDQLREAIAKHRAAGPHDDLQPLPPSADRDASAFLSAHNMYVGSDPFLDDLDRTTRGPDSPLPAADPDEIKKIATTARQDDILAEASYDFMVEASNAAPVNYDQNNRHSRFAAGLAQNFARYGIEILWAYPNESAWAGVAAGFGATVLLGPLAAAGGTVAGIAIAYNMARNMIANEAFYRKLLATSPAGEDNFNRLIHFLKTLPIKSLKDD